MFCDRVALLPSWAQCGPCVSFCGKLPRAVAAIRRAMPSACPAMAVAKKPLWVALTAPSSAHWSLWVGWRLNKNFRHHTHCICKGRLENVIKVMVSIIIILTLRHSMVILSSLIWSYSPSYRNSPFKVESYLQSLFAPHPPIPGQAGAKDAVDPTLGISEREREGIRFMKGGKLFPSTLLSAGKVES